MSGKLRLCAAFVAVFGAAFCVVEALDLGLDAICGTAGCAFTSQVSLLGLSLYWLGAAAFAAYAALLFFASASVLFLFSVLLLAADSFLLAVLAFASPCVSCLVVGVLFFLLFLLSWKFRFGYFLRGHDWSSQRKLAVAVSVLWLFVAAPNVLGIAQEAVAPQPIYGNSDAPMKIFFSPTCPQCKKMIRKTVRGGHEDRIALYPVAHDDEDIERMCILDCKLREGDSLDLALNECWSGGHSSRERGFWHKLRLSLISHLNQSYLMNMGKTRVPVLVSRTSPALGQDQARKGVNIEFDSSSSRTGAGQGCGFVEDSGCSDM